MRATIAGSTFDALLVPRSAVLRDETGDHVFIAEAAHARRCDVEILLDRGADIALAGSLNAGDAVVVTGNFQLSDGIAVTESRGSR
jgi:multidrug efflux pump subunit AcrA (membrane-fusion protein)